MRNVMITGHRPPKIGGYDRFCETRIWLRDTLKDVVKRIYGKHPGSQFYSGMALGTDQDFAEVVINLGLDLIAICPGKWQPNKWPMQSKLHYYDLIRDCTEIRYIDNDIEPYSKNVRDILMQRNSALVDAADAGIAVWDGSESGTMDAINKMNEKGLVWLHVNPKTRQLKWNNVPSHSEQ